MIIKISIGGNETLLEPTYEGVAKLYMPDTYYVDYNGSHKYHRLSPIEMRIFAANLIAVAKEVERLKEK